MNALTASTSERLPLVITRSGETLHLFPEKAVYWKEQEMLILSDLHLGKSHHFQKHGIPLPAGSQDITLKRLKYLIERTSASRILFLGDLFHSKYNQEWVTFKDWLVELKRVIHPRVDEFRLIKGNHDILPESFYLDAGLELHEVWKEGPFLFIHDSESVQKSGSIQNPDLSDQPAALIRISGHKHPGVRIRAKARQSITLPCYHFTGSDLFLPAFGELTGIHLITQNPEDEVYAIAENELLMIPYSKRRDR